MVREMDPRLQKEDTSQTSRSPFSGADRKERTEVAGSGHKFDSESLVSAQPLVTGADEHARSYK